MIQPRQKNQWRPPTDESCQLIVRTRLVERGGERRDAAAYQRALLGLAALGGDPVSAAHLEQRQERRG